MGLNAVALDLLLEMRNAHGSLGETVSLGRQDLMVSYPQFEDLFAKHDVPIDHETIQSFYTEEDQYSEPLLRFLGATKTDSIDASDFEGATIVHDLCAPIPEALHKSFDLVMDFGTLEHVFNFPVGIKSCMEMTRVGGHVMCINPSNNLVGHGFYQFSPELMYRVFSAENGFRVRTMLYVEGGKGRTYEVVDPEEVRQRVTTVGIYPANLAVIAERVEVREIFASFPHQSDYSARWESESMRTTAEGRMSFWNAPTAPVEISAKDAAIRRVRAPLGRLRRRFTQRVLKRLHLTPDETFFVPKE